MKLRVTAFAVGGLIVGAVVGGAVGSARSGVVYATGSTPEERSRFIAESVSETLNCAAAFAAIGLPAGAVAGWWTARKSVAAR